MKLNYAFWSNSLYRFQCLWYIFLHSHLMKKILVFSTLWPSLGFRSISIRCHVNTRTVEKIIWSNSTLVYFCRVQKERSSLLVSHIRLKFKKRHVLKIFQTKLRKNTFNFVAPMLLETDKDIGCRFIINIGIKQI